MQTLLRILLIGATLLALPLIGSADIYRYRDVEGRLTFVDDPGKIPPQYRNQTTPVAETQNSLGVFESQDQETSATAPVTAETEKTSHKIARQPRHKYRTPVDIRGNRVLVPVEVAIGNRVAKLSLLLDTGASITVFYRQSLTDLELPSGKNYRARVAGGGLVKSEKITLRHLHVGPFKEKGVSAMIINLQGRELPFDGMLGMDFLKNHPYQIDFATNVITWEPID